MIVNLGQLRETYHDPVVAVADGWWGGRRVADKLPRLLYRYFVGTSFAVEEDGEIITFLVGIVGSPADEAYVHFVGVRPDPGRGGWGGASTGCSSTRPAGAGAAPCGPSPPR